MNSNPYSDPIIASKPHHGDWTPKPEPIPDATAPGSNLDWGHVGDAPREVPTPLAAATRDSIAALTPEPTPAPELKEEPRYTLTVAQALSLFRTHQRKPLSERRLQEICAAGQIVAKKITTASRTEWILNEASLVDFIQKRPVDTDSVITTPTQPTAMPTAPAGPVNDPRAAAPRDRDASPPANPDAAPEGETRTLAEALLENSRLFAEVQVLTALLKKAEEHATIRVEDLTKGYEKTITLLEQQRDFNQEELREFRKSAVDVAQIAQAMTQVFLVSANKPGSGDRPRDINPTG